MINGVLNVYKEKGYTSHDVVAKLRGILKQKKSDIQELWIRRLRSTAGMSGTRYKTLRHADR